MRTRTRLATTASLTILGCTTMSGIAQADTGGSGLTGGLTGSVSRTVGGVVKQTTTQTSRTVRQVTSQTSRTVRQATAGSAGGLHVRLRLSEPSAPGRGAARGPAVGAGVDASLGGARVKASLGLCAGCQAPNPTPQPPPTPPTPPSPPVPPSPPGSQPPGSQPPGSVPPVARPPLAVPPALALPAGKAELQTIDSALPYTGGPIGAMAFLGAIAVVTGAAAVIGARPKARLSA